MRSLPAVRRAAWFAVLLAWGASGTASAQAVKLLEGHTEPVYATAYSTDGAILATGSFDRTVRLWDRATGKSFRTIADHTNLVLTVALSKDGLQLASGGLDNVVRLYDVPKRTPLADLGAQPGEVAVVALSYDGKLLATGDKSKAVRLFDALTGAHQRDLAGLSGEPAAFAFSRDGALLLAASAEGTIRGWKTADGMPAGLISTPPAAALEFHPDNKQLFVVSADGFLRVYNWPPAAEPVTLAAAPQPLQTLALSFDGKLVACASADGQARLHDPATGAALRAVNHGGGPLRAVAFSRDNLTLATGGMDGLLKVWKTADGMPAGELLAHGGPIRDVAFHLNGQQVFTAGEDGLVRVWALPVAAARDAAPHAAPIRALAVSNDGALLVTASDDKTAKLVQFADGKEVRPFAGHDAQVYAAALSANNGQVLTGGEDKKLRLFNAGDGALVKAIEGHAAAIRAVAFSPNGQQLVSGSADNVVKVWNAADGAAVRDLAGHAGPAAGIEFLPNGEKILTAADTHLRAFNAADGAQAFAINTSAPVARLAIARDGMLVAVGGGDNKVRVYKIADQQPAGLFEGHAGPVIDVRFSNDGKRLLSLSSDRTARVWDLAQGKELQRFNLPANATGAAFSADGKTLAAASEDGHVRFLPVACAAVFAGHQGPVTSLAVHPGGTHLISGGDDKTVIPWHLGNLAKEATFDGATAGVSDVAVSPNSQFVATASADKHLRVYQFADRKLLLDLALPYGLSGLSFSADGTRLAGGGDDMLLRVFETATGAALEQFVGFAGPVAAAAFSPDGKTIAVASTGDAAGRIVPFSALRGVKAHEGAALALALQSDGALLYTAGADKLVAQWNPANLQKARNYEGPTLPVRSLAVTRANQALVAGGEDKTLYAWNAGNGAPLAKLDLGEPIVRVAANADGKVIVAATSGPLVRNLRLAEAAGMIAFTASYEWSGHTAAVTSVALSPDAKTVFTGGADRTVKRYAVAASEARFTLSGHTAHIYDVVFSPDGKLLATASADKTIKLWTTADGKNTATCTGHTAQVYGVAFDPKNPQLVSCGSDNTIRYWTSDTGRQTKEVKTGITDALYTIGFSPDGGSVLTAGLAKSWLVFPTGGDAPAKTITGHPDHIYAAAYTPDGGRVVTVGYGGTVFVWDAASGNKIFNQNLPGARAAFALDVAPDGKEIAVGTSDNRVMLMTLP